jgi:hypothetical protein
MHDPKVPPGWKKSIFQSFDVLVGACFQTLAQDLLAFQEEVVKYITRIKVVSDDHPRQVDAFDDGSLAGARTWSMERGNGAVSSVHEAVIDVACVEVIASSRALY